MCEMEQSKMEYLENGSHLQAWKSSAGIDIVFKQGMEQESCKCTHWEEYIQIFLLESGEAYFECNEKQMYAKKDSVVIINSSEMYFFKALTPELSYYHICFIPSFLCGKNADICQKKYLHPLEEKLITFENFINEDQELLLILHQFIEEFEQKEFGYELMIKASMCKLIAYLMRNHVCNMCTNREATCAGNCRKRFLPVFSYIEEHYTEKIQVNDLASLIDITPCHFCRTFKQISKKTLIDYVNTVRLFKACDTLVGTLIPISEVAAICGFEDMNYFIRIFKKYYRVTPNQYRKSWNGIWKNQEEGNKKEI